MTNNKAYWDSRKATWDLVDHPLKPNDEDIENFSKYITTQKTPLVLGCTPRLLSFAEAIGRPTCVDFSEEMSKPYIDETKVDFVKSDWTYMPFKDKSFDVVLGDGCFSVLPSIHSLIQLNQELNRVLTPGGIIIMRVFIKTSLFVDEENYVYECLLRGEIKNFHTFKWRLFMSMLDLDEKVELSKFHDSWSKFYHKHPNIFEKMNWNPELIKTIDVYKDVKATYQFPSLITISETMRNFSIEGISAPSYFDGRRYPVVCMKKSS